MLCDEGLCVRLVNWLTAYTYPVVFFGTLVDASGLPFPGRLLLVAAGALAGTGRRNVAVIIALGVIAAMVMDHLWYVAAARGTTRVLALYRRLAGSTDDAEEPAVDYFTRYGGFTILLGRFFTFIRLLAWPTAAAHGVGYAKFVVLDLVGATAWASIWVLLGWIVGTRWRAAAETAGVWLALGGIVVLIAGAAPVVTRIWRMRKRARRARQRERGR